MVQLVLINGLFGKEGRFLIIALMYYVTSMKPIIVQS